MSGAHACAFLSRDLNIRGGAGMVVVRICIDDHLTEYRYEGRFKVTTP